MYITISYVKCVKAHNHRSSSCIFLGLQEITRLSYFSPYLHECKKTCIKVWHL